jgi:hypothetical protein
MTFKTQPVHIEWTLYLKSGPVQIWEGKPERGSWTQWECRNVQSGETRHIDKNNVLQTFDQMTNNQES